jgi:hypothetical protein
MTIKKGPRLQKLENFLTKPESIESTSYISDLLSKKLKRPEETFVQKILNDSFWEEMGFSETERKFEAPAGITGRVEWSLQFEDRKIAIECKTPYKINSKNQEEIHQLNGNDVHELENQLGRYLEDHDYIIFTNGFFWFFYSQTSYRTWKYNKDKVTKKGKVFTPYFKKITSEELFDENSSDYILNILPRLNILETLRSMEHRSIRNPLADDFFIDLKNWIDYLDFALKDTKESIRKTSATLLINKLIFLRTMEGVGIISSDFVCKLWDAGKEVNTTIPNFINRIDDSFSEKFNTELFISQYLEDQNGQRQKDEDGLPKENPARKQNLIYEVIPPDFFSAILKRIDSSNLDDKGETKIILNGRIFYIKSLYWWKFEKISGDILGKAYETYLALSRKKLGIYYTPDQLTEYISLSSVGKVFDGHIAQLQEEFAQEKWNIEKLYEIGNKFMDIKICDPSCGSGSFLIQAIRLIWKKYHELEKIVKDLDDKFAKGKSTLDAYFTNQVAVLRTFEASILKKDDKQLRMGTLVIRHIHGNDKDQKAVSTSKLNIWLECLRLDPNSYKIETLKNKRHVLPNLELNLTTGDSLLDVDIELMDASFNVETRGTISSIFKLRENYLNFFDRTSNAHDAADLRDRLIEYFLKDAFKIGDQVFNDLSKIKPTFWALQHFNAFYDKNGNLKSKDERGFDIIIGNPPWEKLKIMDREFFADIEPEIANASTAAIRKKMIQELEQKNPVLYREYNETKNQSKSLVTYFTQSKKFPHSAVGDVNLYPLFLELSHNLLKKGGMLGMVIPSGILTDLSYQKFLEYLISSSSIIACHDFTNKKRLFKDIIENVRFCLMFLTSEKSGGENFILSVLNETIEDIDKHVLHMNNDDIALFNPNSKACPLFVKNQDYVICKKIYQNNPILINIKEKTNPWNIEYWGMYHMTKDSNLFHTKEFLEKRGFIKNDKSWFVKNNLKFIPLCEAKFFSNYDHRHGSFENVPVNKRFGIKAEPHHPNSDEKGNTKYEIEPRYWVPENEVLKKYNAKNIFPESCFIFRDVCRTFTDSRTARGTLVPFSAAGNTAPILIFRNPDIMSAKKDMILFSNIFSSFVFDYIVRQKISGAHLSKYILIQIAFPKPSKFKETNINFNGTTKTLEDWLLDASSKLIPVTENFNDLFKIFNISKPIKWNEDDRFDQICFVNALVGKAYGLDKIDFEYILNQFPILKNQEEREHGYFRSLEKCLDYFKEIKITK